MRSPRYHHNGFVATDALGYMIYGSLQFSRLRERELSWPDGSFSLGVWMQLVVVHSKPNQSNFLSFYSFFFKILNSWIPYIYVHTSKQRIHNSNIIKKLTPSRNNLFFLYYIFIYIREVVQRWITVKHLLPKKVLFWRCESNHRDSK